MEEHPSADDIVKVEMQDVYPPSRQQIDITGHEDHSPITSTSRHLMDPSRGSHYDHVGSMGDQSAISVEQRAAAIMDRIKQVCVNSSPFGIPLDTLFITVQGNDMGYLVYAKQRPTTILRYSLLLSLPV